MIVIGIIWEWIFDPNIGILNQILNLYDNVKENYPDLNEKQISEQLDFSPSTIRRYKKEKELLTNLREKDMEK